MKKLYTLAIVVLLAGCSMLAPDFDNNEYGQFVRLETHAEYLQEECKTGEAMPRLNAMKFYTNNLVSYTSNLNGNDELARVAEILYNDLQEMLNRNEMSKTYCE